jgi:hypothetical protein
VTGPGLFFALVALVVVARFVREVLAAARRRRLADWLHEPRTRHTPYQVVVEGRFGDELVRFIQTAGSPGTVCQVECNLPRALHGTLCAGVAPGSAPRLVGGTSPTPPADFSSADAAPPLQTLLERCSYVRVGEGKVDTRFEDESTVRQVLEALVALARALRAAAPQTSVELHERMDVSAGCPYCREALDEREVIACGSCGTQHHAECLLEHGRCTVLACGGRARPQAEA